MTISQNNSSLWPDDKIARLKELLAQGHSCSQVAKALEEEGYRHASRNAVIGKANRLGLVLKTSNGSSGRPAAVQPRKPRVQHQYKLRQEPPAPPHEPIAKHAIAARSTPFVPLTNTTADQAIPLSHRRTLLQLENHHCRWPVGEPKEPGFFYCGAPEADVAGRVPYCRAHMQRAKGRPATREEREDAIAAQRAYEDTNKRRLFA